MPAVSPVDQGFVLRIKHGSQTQERLLDRRHWSEVSFIGEYPIGYVEYRDPESPAGVSLEAFSPFIPLNADDSALPATVMAFTVRNHGRSTLEVELCGWLQNSVCLYSGPRHNGVRRNRLVRRPEFLFLECLAEETPAPLQQPRKPSGLAVEGDSGTLGLALLTPKNADYGCTHHGTSAGS